MCAQTSSSTNTRAVIHGSVLDASGKAVAGATVDLDEQGAPIHLKTSTDNSGAFDLNPSTPGSYRLTASDPAQRTTASADITVVGKEQQSVVLTLSPVRHIGDSNKSSTAGTSAMEFSDSPNFTVAGVTDWTAVGGHGSDSTLRTSEDLARETAALKAQNKDGSIDSKGDEHRHAGDLAEKQGDALAAVREYQEAVRLNPSEANYFAWGSELLVHRAVLQAAEVFRKGVQEYPTSSRLLTALGAALFASDLYDEAAAHLCAASDLAPADPEPYLFMGKIEIASPSPLPCVAPKLARFAQDQPGSASANYLYAMAILKDRKTGDQVAGSKAEELLKKAVMIDPNCAEAYLQLGILAAGARHYEEAAAFYNKAIAADPESGEAHYRLGVAEDRLGKADQAKLEFAAHEEIEKRKTAQVEQQRKEIKQFEVQVHEPDSANTHLQ
jgi:Flp pilus assembly protein TadD